ncbi:MAG: ABC transporter permease, partial [Anaerolineales bacterium]|nr:ABC transporter permease [Anaerolineales bacterium]
MALFLSFKEVWRNKGRFILFSLVIALITTLVLFVAALAEGLAQANRQYLEKLDAELLVFQANTELSTNASRLDRSDLNAVARIPGVQAAGPIGFATGTILQPGTVDGLDASLIGIEPDRPGSPPVVSGNPINSSRGSEVVIDRTIAREVGLSVGSVFTLRTIQNTEEEFFDLRVIGITDSREYQYAASIFLPYQTWDEIRPQAGQPGNQATLASNVIAIKLKDPSQQAQMIAAIESRVDKVEVTDIATAIKALPGYSVQQSTLQTQQAFVLLIGILVIGGFFQIQILQKIPQIGVLKAIGVANQSVAWAVIWQIILVTAFGVTLGGLATLGLAAG